MLVSLISLAVAVKFKVAPMTVGQLYKGCDAVVSAQVKSVEHIEGFRVATAKVATIFKGKNIGQEVTFLAEQIWTCDTSWAMPSERVILYLHRSEPKDFSEISRWTRGNELYTAARKLAQQNKPFYSIGHSGRGRLFLRQLRGVWGVAITYSGSKKAQANLDLVLPDRKKVIQKSTKEGFISIENLLSYRN